MDLQRLLQADKEKGQKVAYLKRRGVFPNTFYFMKKPETEEEIEISIMLSGIYLLNFLWIVFLA